jgi:hypothetical protein
MLWHSRCIVTDVNRSPKENRRKSNIKPFILNINIAGGAVVISIPEREYKL